MSIDTSSTSTTSPRPPPWLHGILAAYPLWAGLAVLASCALGGRWVVARRGPDAPRRVASIFLGGLGAVLALGANQLIGKAVARTRPCHVLHHTVVLLASANDPSFPSDHAMIAGALTVGLFMLDRRLGFVGLALAVLLAFARVYSGVHYPTDVAAGLVIGVAIDTIVVVVFRRTLTAAARLLGTPSTGW